MANTFDRGKYNAEERVIGPSLDIIERSYNILLALPDSDTARFFKIQDYDKPQTTENTQEVCKQLIFDIYNLFKFFWWTNVFKARQLTSALIQCYNSNNFMAWLILGRSSLEYAAVSYYFVKKIKRFQPQSDVLEMSKLREMEETFLKYIHGTRFNWSDLLAGNTEGLAKKFTPPESSSAVNVLTALEHLAKRDDRYVDVKIAYDMMSDFSHPNMASHTSVVEMPAMPIHLHECEITAQPKAPRGEFFMVASLPWVSMGISTIVELLIEVTPLLETWLSYLEGDNEIIVDFTK